MAIVQSLSVNSANAGHYHINITAKISSSTFPLCGVLDFGDHTTQILFFRTINASQCSEKLNITSSTFEEHEVTLGASSFIIEHIYA